MQHFRTGGHVKWVPLAKIQHGLHYQSVFFFITFRAIIVKTNMLFLQLIEKFMIVKKVLNLYEGN